MKLLKIADFLSLPLESVSRTFGILAARGAGKSNAAAVMAEEMFAAGLPFVVVDPVGSWYGLRSSEDGSKPGLPIPIFGGKHGDVPLDRTNGVLMADLVVTKRLSCVLDLSTFESESAKKQFLLDFARQLYQKNEDPLHLFLEEADDYIPQKPMRDETQLLRAWENIVRRGRSRGLGMTMITQRSAVINKSVLTQVETLFVLRTTGPQDIAAIEAWVRYHQADKKILSSLAGLPDGDAWIWSPSFLKIMERVHIRRRRTFDSGATPKNFTGSNVKPVATLADVNLDDIQKQMAATIEKHKADDPAQLRRQIAVLTAELKKANTFQASQRPVEPERVEVSVLLDDDRDLLREFSSRLDSFREEVNVVNQGMEDIAARDRAYLNVRQPVQFDKKTVLMPKREPHSRPAQTSSSLPIGESKILTAIAQYPSGATREQISILTGYKRSSRDAYVQRLAGRGFIRFSGDSIFATDEGVRILGPYFEPLPTGDALIEYWLEKLPAGESTIFQILVGASGKPVNRDHISSLSEYQRSSRDAYLQRLTARKLVVNRGGGMVSAAAFLFE